MATLDAWMAVGGYVRQEYGDYGYRISQADCPDGYRYNTICCRVRHSDGSEWYIHSDGYGNIGDSNKSDIHEPQPVHTQRMIECTCGCGATMPDNGLCECGAPMPCNH
jgi:hypothetical protein